PVVALGWSKQQVEYPPVSAGTSQPFVAPQAEPPPTTSDAAPNIAVGQSAASDPEAPTATTDSIRRPSAFSNPSFECALATHQVEQMICASFVLAELDRTLDD